MIASQGSQLMGGEGLRKCSEASPTPKAYGEVGSAYFRLSPSAFRRGGGPLGESGCRKPAGEGVVSTHRTLGVGELTRGVSASTNLPHAFSGRRR